ncbi:MAG: PBP1A family penicillin-binding protein [Gemmatimonadota bacterium]|nr:PBP1A family penicillin-binding protein [Gemmatimonadota bacterium]
MAAFPFSRQFGQRHPRLTRSVLLALTFLMSGGVGLAYASWALVCNAGRCPSARALDDYTPGQTSKLYAIDGRFIAEIGLERRTLVTINEIPQSVRDAFRVTEDKRFYNHAGVDWVRVFGAVAANVTQLRWAEGFSTITMQLARNVFPERISREKTLTRKLKEAKVARDIEARFSKDKILELYLNQIDLGSGAHGVESASQRYFGKSVRDLNVAEAATLAGIPKAPSRYNPRRFPDRAIQRRNTVIELMRRQGVISDSEASLAKAYPLQLASKAEAGDVAPYFVEWVRQQLDERFGAQLYREGLKVYTTLDVNLQSAAERALENQIRAIEAGRFGPYRGLSFERHVAQAGNDDAAAGPHSPYLQGAFVAIDARTGAGRAMVGGRDFDDSKFNRAVQALRQPGSAFKPIVFAAGIQNGRSPAYVLSDDPLSLEQRPGEMWQPKNYDGSFEGNIPMRRALYQSRNLATIRLGMELGEATVIEEARRFGITSPIPAYPSIHIGAASVYPIEMVAAYSAFATLGTRAEPQPIVRVENTKGEVLWAPEPVRTPVLSQEEAWLMVSMMRDAVTRGTAAGAVAGSGFRIPAGGKTGTTNDGTDVWFIGYTPDLVAGVWMGFDRPQRIKSNAQGGALAAPAWTTFMREVYRRRPAPSDWPQPPGVVERMIDRSTAMLATAYCPPELVTQEYFIIGTDPPSECPAHGPYATMPGMATYDTTGIAPPPAFPPLDTAPRRRPSRTATPSTPDAAAPGAVLPGAIIPGLATPPRRSRATRDTSARVRLRRDSLRPSRDTAVPPGP